ncbi:hypothetical protein XENTR_v10022348 [Xenopus tropicalis]|nr:hypothetical protein XENTR_v10022348 [Xenopus tropicalis]
MENGGVLPERHQLSDSNKTLTVPSTDTGTFTALVSNPVSHSSAHYNLTLPEFPSRCRSVGAGIIIAAVSLVFAAGIWICFCKSIRQKCQSDCSCRIRLCNLPNAASKEPPSCSGGDLSGHLSLTATNGIEDNDGPGWLQVLFVNDIVKYLLL